MGDGLGMGTMKKKKEKRKERKERRKRRARDSPPHDGSRLKMTPTLEQKILE